MAEENTLSASEQRKQKLIESYVTLCCEAPVEKIGPAAYICSECRGEATTDFAIFCNMLSEEQ